MAKSRKKARKAAKRPAKKRVAKRKSAAKAKPRKAAKKKPRKAKPRKETSIIDMVTGAVSEARELRSRLAGHNTFED
jgi:hypothetical protein